MSRLFEALSGLKTEHRAMEVITPLTIAPPTAVPSTPKQDGETGKSVVEGSSPDRGPTRTGSAGARAGSGASEQGRAEAGRAR